MIFYPIISVMLLIIFAYILYLGWFLSPKPITTRDLSSVVSIIVAIWFVKNIKDSVDRFLDDRIIIASEWFMKFRESGVLQEIVTIEDENHNFIRKDVRLIKYVSKCAICDAQIYLDKGEPDYAKRIVGRCKESPREHVFTFDRVTLIGKPLNR